VTVYTLYISLYNCVYIWIDHHVNAGIVSFYYPI